MPSDVPWPEMIAGLRAGDPAVVRQLFERYRPMLERLAERHLAANVKRRVDSDDIAQSACRTFFRRMQAGEFDLDGADSVGPLLSAIALTKVRERTRFHLRQRRGLQRERSIDAESSSGNTPGIDLAGQDPTPDEAAVFAEQLQRLVASLDEEEQRVLQLKLDGHTHDEVAQELHCSERTARRLVKRIQSKLLRQMEA